MADDRLASVVSLDGIRSYGRTPLESSSPSSVFKGVSEQDLFGANDPIGTGTKRIDQA